MTTPSREVITHDDTYKCPWCRESYQDRRSWNHLVKENPHSVTCDGETGCGEDFVVIFMEQA